MNDEMNLMQLLRALFRGRESGPIDEETAREIVEELARQVRLEQLSRVTGIPYRVQIPYRYQRRRYWDSDGAPKRALSSSTHRTVSNDHVLQSTKTQVKVTPNKSILKKPQSSNIGPDESLKISNEIQEKSAKNGQFPVSSEPSDARLVELLDQCMSLVLSDEQGTRDSRIHDDRVSEPTKTDSLSWDIDEDVIFDFTNIADKSSESVTSPVKSERQEENVETRTPSKQSESDSAFVDMQDLAEETSKLTSNALTGAGNPSGEITDGSSPRALTANPVNNPFGSGVIFDPNQVNQRGTANLNSNQLQFAIGVIVGTLCLATTIGTRICDELLLSSNIDQPNIRASHPHSRRSHSDDQDHD